MTKKRPTSKEPNISAVHQHRTDKDIFCHSQEFLLFVDRYDCLFVHEAELRPIRLNDAVRDCQDTTAQIIRMDQENWCGEDVTEDIAHAWLDTYEPEPTHEDTLPAFVLESEAWQLYNEDFKARYGGADHNSWS